MSTPNTPGTRTASGKRPSPATLLALFTLTALLGSACSIPGSGGSDDQSSLGSSTTVQTPTSLPEGEALDTELVAQPWVDASSRAIVTGGFVEIFDGPGGSAAMTLGPTTSFGSARVLLVEEERDGWVKVRLPLRPNHRAGWVPADQVEVEELDLIVQIDLASRVLLVRQGDETLIETPVAIGTADNPTPTGTFSVTDKLETPAPAGPYGPFALGLSGYSETLTEFAGGDGQIGIHGTNDPTSIGLEASHGCVRVANEVIAELAELLPLGTPVHII